MTGVTAIGVTGRGGTVTAAAADKRRNLPRPPFNLKFLRVRLLYDSSHSQGVTCTCL